MTAKEKLRHLVNDLSEGQAQSALAVLERGLDDPVLLFFASAEDEDEPISPAEEAAVAQARAEHARGESVPLEDVVRELG